MVRRVEAAPPAATVVAIALSVLIVLAEVTVVETLRFRAIVLGLGLALAFLTLRVRNKFSGYVPHGLALIALGITLAIAAGGRGFLARASEPTTLDLGLGLGLLALVVGAAWVSTGSALPVLSIATVAYVLWGSELDRVGLSVIAHRGYDVPRLVGSMVMGFEGVFGVPLDVAATTINHQTILAPQGLGQLRRIAPSNGANAGHKLAGVDRLVHHVISPGHEQAQCRIQGLEID